uniref:Replication factor C subunit 2 n=1 Tax=Parastrongyloides trichosuri TaxID=131310 RepID=A0A0N4ZX21_PARTI
MGDTPWIEKYRPRRIDDIVGNEVTMSRLKFFAKKGNVPNLLLSGPPGCGKTTCIWAMANELLGEYAKRGILELNASDERGIDVVRDKIKHFCQSKVTFPSPHMTKILILDEADSMTEGAQQAMRRIMEEYSDTTRFAFACNQSEKIIEPLQSRCGVIRFSKLTDEEMLKRLLYVCDKEEVTYDPKGLQAIIFTADGDMRQALNNLQCTVAAYENVTADYVYKVCDEPHPDLIKGIFDHCAVGNMTDAFKIVDQLYKLGYSIPDIMNHIGKICKVCKLPEVLKLEYLREIGLVHADVLRGVASRMQLAGLIARLSMIQKRVESETVKEQK